MTLSSHLYVIDTSALIDLDGQKIGSNPKTAYKCDDSTRKKIWASIEEMGKLGGVVAVHEQRIEIERHLPHVHKRLDQIDGFYRPDTPEVVRAAMQVLAKAPCWVAELLKRGPQYPMADPVIVALAQIEGRIVVTNEIHRRDRKTKDARIPDICDDCGVLWAPLEKFVRQENLDS